MAWQHKEDKKKKKQQINKQKYFLLYQKFQKSNFILFLSIFYLTRHKRPLYRQLFIVWLRFICCEIFSLKLISFQNSHKEKKMLGKCIKWNPQILENVALFPCHLLSCFASPIVVSWKDGPDTQERSCTSSSRASIPQRAESQP